MNRQSYEIAKYDSGIASDARENLQAEEEHNLWPMKKSKDLDSQNLFSG